MWLGTSGGQRERVAQLVESCKHQQLQFGQIVTPPPRATDPRFFCRERAGKISHYDRCTKCRGPPICCEFPLAQTSARYQVRQSFGQNVPARTLVHSYTESRCPDAGMRQLHLCVRMLAQGARRCVGKYDSAFRPVSACLSAGKQWPLACPPAPPPPPPPVDARWFCHEERSAKSFYDRCSGPCVSTPVCGPQDTLLRSCAVLATTTHSPSHLGTYAYVCVRLKQICCDFGTARISQHYPGARRCVTGDAAHRAGVGRQR